MAWRRTKANKYGVAPKAKRTFDGVVYDSKLEKDWMVKLKLLERAGQISDLRTQVSFPIILNDVLVCQYIADFVYSENGSDVVADAKGMLTKEYILKKKLMKAVYGIDIKEFTYKTKSNGTTKRKSIRKGDIW